MKPELPAHLRRDKPVTAMVTASEKEALATFAREVGMSTSNALRFLYLRALAQQRTGDNPPFTPLEGDSET